MQEKQNSMHSHHNFSDLFPQVFLVLSLERVGMDHALSAGAAHTHVPSDPHLHSSLNSAQNLFAPRYALPGVMGPPIYLLTWIEAPSYHSPGSIPGVPCSDSHNMHTDLPNLSHLHPKTLTAYHTNTHPFTHSHRPKHNTPSHPQTAPFAC